MVKSNKCSWEALEAAEPVEALEAVEALVMHQTPETRSIADCRQ